MSGHLDHNLYAPVKTRSYWLTRDVRITVVQMGAEYRLFEIESARFSLEDRLTRYGLRCALTELGMDSDLAHAICNEIDREVT